MKNAVLYFTAFIFCISAFLFGCGKEAAQSQPDNIAMKRMQMVQIAKEAYVYGFPMVLAEITKRYMTNPLSDTENLPVNQIRHFHSFADDKFKNFTRPLSDIFYSAAWLDLSKEPILFEIPDTSNRYTLFTIINAWTDVLASSGRRTNGTNAYKFAVMGTHWEGTLPEGFEEYRSNTNMVLVTGVIQVKNAQDEMDVEKIQNAIKVYPLSSYDKKYDAPKGVADDTLSVKVPLEQVFSMNISDFFNTFNNLMLKNPPYSQDEQILDKILDIGVAPGMRFDLSTFDFDTQEAFKEIPRWLKDNIESIKMEGAEKGWNYNLAFGSYKVDYTLRAKTAYLNFGASLNDDIVCIYSYADSDNEKYDFSKKYVLSFKKDEIPPANALWSVSLYNGSGYLVKNSIKRFSLGSKDNLRFNKDGSLEIYIQKDNPGKDKQSNWLPCGEEEFSVALRCYWPKDNLLDGSWKAPSVVNKTE
ncbi:MAG: DUF1254 domain-containing protein [Endomicrobium sp.]|jgi:hypothetical protein|nr:DUF1254 domain-containing protein [Endomicrobium sp.]